MGEYGGALDADQVRVLFFRNMEHGRRKAQERLLKLYQRGRLDRCRPGEGPYCYYQGEKPGMLEHLLGVNWVRIWLQTSCRSWERVHSFSYEQDYGILRADGFAAIKNTVTGKYRFCFVEMDRGTNEFDKVKKYVRLFLEGGYAGRWWVGLTDRFPPVLVVTTGPRRADHIRERIEIENIKDSEYKKGLEFNVVLLDEIKEGLINGNHRLLCEAK